MDFSLRMGSRLGIAPDSEHRYRSAILHSLREAGHEGHCFLTQSATVEHILQLLSHPSYSTERIEQQMFWLVTAQELRVEKSRKYPGRLGYYLHAFYQAETAIAA